MNKKPTQSKLVSKILGWYNYATTGVWEDTRNTIGVRLMKTLNLAVRSFTDRGLQIRSMSLTYSTVLAIVPAFALLIAIGRGFGYQKILETALYSYFPSQSKAVGTALSFVDSYLNNSSQGLFVGAGAILLLWTVISLLSSIELAFNSIWNIKRDRNLYQKVTAYIAICLLVPILMVCSSGVSIFMATTLQNKLDLKFLTPMLNTLLETLPVVFAWGGFTLCYALIPNTKVNFKYAAIAGAFGAIAFQILQMLFVNGQIYVSKYNAIYGSFSFLPLMLIWLQLSWLILLSGCVLTYSLQNVFTFDFLGDISSVSENYKRKISILLMTILIDYRKRGEQPPTASDISTNYGLPIRIITRIIDAFHEAKLIYYVVLPKDEVGITPAFELNELTAGEFIKKLDRVGPSDFIPGLDKNYPDLLAKIDNLITDMYSEDNNVLMTDLPTPNVPDQEPSTSK
ncbi:MAG: YihY/virulence factor BrkB family protein [Bacteroides sp.]|nr:YihY/virulence factor BrkB family protein [Bacteroides sp.]